MIELVCFLVSGNISGVKEFNPLTDENKQMIDSGFKHYIKVNSCAKSSLVVNR